MGNIDFSWTYIYLLPFIGVYIVTRRTYRKAEKHAIRHGRKKMHKRAETRDIAMRPSKKPDITEKNTQQSVLLRLPLELRCEIYDFVYPESRHIVIENSPRKGHIQGHIWTKVMCPCDFEKCCSHYKCAKRFDYNALALPLSCQQLYAESIAYMYSKGTFHFKGYDNIMSVPEVIPAKHLRCITSLNLRIAVDPLSNYLGLISRTHFTRAEFGSRQAIEVHGRPERWLQFWRDFSVSLVSLQHLSITFDRKNPILARASAHVELEVCEWLLEALLPFGDRELHRGKAPLRFDVYLGFDWNCLAPAMNSALAAKHAGRTVPFVVKRSSACIHDTR